jgi:hypothetical protein
MNIFVYIGNSRYMVDENNRVFRVSRGEEKEIKGGETVALARRFAANLRAIRNSAALRASRSKES